MRRVTSVELANLCLIYDEDSVLVQEKQGTGGLVFPGGHVENGESVLESVIREVREETGLLIRKPELCGIKDWCEEDGTRYLVMLYKTNQFEGNLRSSQEGRVFWLKRNDMDTANLIWNMRELMEIFEGSSYSEFFIRTTEGNYQKELLGETVTIVQ
ncbi:MAG: 8-oxo-dGTP diphosphatase [Lachnospiraceae bacterium]|nr:8-oxo-dGTP diphosphatase [Lachnospiraceae bacterium]